MTERTYTISTDNILELIRGETLDLDEDGTALKAEPVLPDVVRMLLSGMMWERVAEAQTDPIQHCAACTTGDEDMHWLDWIARRINTTLQMGMCISHKAQWLDGIEGLVNEVLIAPHAILNEPSKLRAFSDAEVARIADSVVSRIEQRTSAMVDEQKAEVPHAAEENTDGL